MHSKNAELHSELSPTVIGPGFLQVKRPRRTSPGDHAARPGRQFPSDSLCPCKVRRLPDGLVDRLTPIQAGPLRANSWSSLPPDTPFREPMGLSFRLFISICVPSFVPTVQFLAILYWSRVTFRVWKNYLTAHQYQQNILYQTWRGTNTSFWDIR